MVAIKIINLTKNYGNKTIIDNMSLDINREDMIVFQGSSGCGKSTLLNIIGMLEDYDNGSLEIMGKKANKVGSAINNKLIREQISYLFQNNALVENFSVKDNVLMALKYSEISLEQKIKKIEQCMDLVGLRCDIDEKIYKLSGGEQQRVGIIRAILKPSNIILADEPTGSLDSVNRDLILKIFKYINKELKKTIVIVTHDPEVALIANKVYNL